jgi:hypothetical protein
METQNFKSFLCKKFECYCVITIQTQIFIPYFGHVYIYMYFYNKNLTNIFNQNKWLIKFMS